MLCKTYILTKWNSTIITKRLPKFFSRLFELLYHLQRKSYPLDVNQCSHQTTQYKFTTRYVKSSYKGRRGQLEHVAQENAGTKSKHLRKLPVKQYLCVCPCVCVCVRVCHHSSPSMVLVSKQCSYIFSPAFSFMACKGTALTSSSLGYTN